jgi:hypothetical protein
MQHFDSTAGAAIGGDLDITVWLVGSSLVLHPGVSGSRRLVSRCHWSRESHAIAEDEMSDAPDMTTTDSG